MGTKHYELTDGEWNRIKDTLPPEEGRRGENFRNGTARGRRYTAVIGNGGIWVFLKQSFKLCPWIRAGRIAADDFYAWSEQARMREADCERGDMTPDEFKAWLKRE